MVTSFLHRIQFVKAKRTILLLMALVSFLSIFAQEITETFDTPGEHTFIVPNGVTELTLEGWGAGGAGGSRTSNGVGAGGGGGAYTKKVVSVTPGEVLNLNVGKGGDPEIGVLNGGNTTVHLNGDMELFVEGGGGGLINDANQIGIGGGCYGFNSEGFAGEDYGVGGLTFVRVNMPQPFEIKNLNVNFRNIGTGGNFIMGLFTNDANNPGELISQSTAQAAVVGWNTVSVGVHAEQPAGIYWIGIQSQSSQLKIRYTGSSTAGDFPSKYTNSAVTWATSFTSPVAATLTDYTSGRYLIYMNVLNNGASEGFMGGTGGAGGCGSSGGGGAGGAGTTENGTTVGCTSTAGSGGNDFGGNGGNGVGTNSPGNDGSDYGGGGGGARRTSGTQKGGKGGNGAIKITYTPPPPIRLMFVTQPSNMVCTSTNLSSPPVVVALDEFDQVVSSYSGTVTLSNAGGIGMTGNSVAAVDGYATFTNLQFTVTGSAGVLTTSNSDGLDNASSIVGVTVDATQGAPVFTTPTITPTSITWNWNAVPGATSYEGSYESAAFADLGLVTSYEETGLDVNQPYLFSVQAEACGNTTEATSLTVYTAANTPSAPTVSAPGGTYGQIDVTVNPNGNPSYTQFAIYCETTGQFVQADGSLGSNEVWLTEADWGTISVTDLAPGTEYEFKVKARNMDEVETPYSATASATTPCAINSFPYFDGMETYTNSTGTNMTTANTCYSNETAHFTLYNPGWSGTVVAYEGTKSARFAWGSKPWLFIPIYLESGETYSFSCFALTPSGGFGSAFITVRIGAAASAASMTTDIISETEIVSGTGWNELLNTFTVPSSGVYYIGIFGETKSSTSGERYIDNIKIDKLSCVEPLNPVHSSVTTTSATVSWDAAITEPGEGYEYYYSTDATAPIESTSANGVVGPTTVSTSLTGLSPSRRYYVWIRSVCDSLSDDYSRWVGPTTFRTLCGFGTVPYFDGFEETEPMNSCYEQESVSRADHPWSRYFAAAYGSIAPYENDYVAALYSPSAGTNNNTQWMFVPVRLESGIQYKVSSWAQGSGANDRISYSFGTSPTVAGMTNSILPITPVSTGGYGEYDALFSVPTTGDYWVGIRGESNTAGGTYLMMDAFEITVESLLPVTLTAFNAVCKDDDTAVEINWTTESEQNSYYFDLEYSRNGTEWYSIGKIPSAGNSNSTIHYSFVDSLRRSSGISYYRLVQYDIDGQFEIFNPISVDCNANINFTLYPNPNNGNFTVNIPKRYRSSSFTMSAYSAIGALVYTEEVEGKGAVNKNINLSDLSPGVYMLTIEMDFGKFYKYKVVIQ